jgi:hypothetical protein
VKAGDDGDSDEEAETAARRDVKIKKKLTKTQLTAQLDTWGVTYLNNSKRQDLQDLVEQGKHAREQERSKEAGDSQNGGPDDDVNTNIASNPEPTRTAKSPTKKRKRQEKEEDKPSRKRAKAVAAKSIEPEGAVHDEDNMNDEDIHMIDADDDVRTEPSPQKKPATEKNLSNQSVLSKHNAASKSTPKGTPSLGAKTQMSKQANSMINLGSDGNLPSLDDEMNVGDQRSNGSDDREVGDERAESSASRRLPRSRSTIARLTTIQPADCITSAQQKNARLNSIDEEEEKDSNSDQEVRAFRLFAALRKDANNFKETLAMPSGRASRRLASKSTRPTRATRSRGASAQGTTNSGPAQEKDEGEEEEYWVIRHHTDNYSDYIPLSMTEKINPRSLEYPQLMSWMKNKQKLERRRAKAEGKPWPPEPTKKKKKYDYRKDPNWWKLEY